MRGLATLPQGGSRSHQWSETGMDGMVWYGIVEFNVPLDTVGHFGDGGPEQ